MPSYRIALKLRELKPASARYARWYTTGRETSMHHLTKNITLSVQHHIPAAAPGVAAPAAPGVPGG